MIDLLRLAAKAAGHEVARIGDDGDSLMLVGVQEPWRPHRDDGQAFRLALGCFLMTERIPCGNEARVDSWSGIHWTEFYVSEADGAATAMRMAILRAAAEVGRRKG